MNKKVLIFSFIILLFAVIGCSKNQPSSSTVKDNKHKKFDVIAEEYFLAQGSKDFDAMKKLLPESEIKEDTELLNGKKGIILNSQFKEQIKGKYTITGFDYYYQSRHQVIYLFDYVDTVTKNPHVFGIYGVEKKGKKYFVMNRFDFKISGSHFQNDTGFPYLRISSLKELMDKYPSNVYQVNPKF